MGRRKRCKDKTNPFFCCHVHECVPKRSFLRVPSFTECPCSCPLGEDCLECLEDAECSQSLRTPCCNATLVVKNKRSNKNGDFDAECGKTVRLPKQISLAEMDILTGFVEGLIEKKYSDKLAESDCCTAKVCPKPKRSRRTTSTEESEMTKRIANLCINSPEEESRTTKAHLPESVPDSTKSTTKSSIFLTTSLICEDSGFDLFFYRTEAALRFLKYDCKKSANGENIHIATTVFEELWSLLMEMHKISYNVNSMLDKLINKEWTLDKKEFEFLFQDLQDGSWTLDKLHDNNVSDVEELRKQIMVLDVYCKVFIDDFFEKWKNLVFYGTKKMKNKLANELLGFFNNFLCLRKKHSDLKAEELQA